MSLFNGEASVEGAASTKQPTGKERIVGVEKFSTTTLPAAPTNKAPAAAQVPATATTTEQPTVAAPVDPATLLSELSAPATTVTTTETQGQSDPTAEVKPTEQPATDDKEAMRAAIREMVQQEFGVDLESIKADNQRQRIQNDVQTLERTWGVDRAEVGTRLATLKTALDGMPENVRQGFNTPQALNILWTSIQASSTQTAPTWNAQSATVPTQTSGLTKADIDAMPTDEYRRRQPEIIAFYQNGV